MPSRAMNRLFVESASGSGGAGAGAGCRDAEPVVLCAPRPRRVQVHPCSADLILGPPPFLLNKSSKEGGRTKPAEDEDGGWAAFGGSPPARADNPLVHDPNFLLNQRHPAAVDPTPLELGFFDHRSRTSYVHRPTYTSSNSNNSFTPSSFAPAVRIQGFDVAACRGSHSNAGGSRVLSARA